MNIFVSNLHLSATEEQLKHLFSRLGNIQSFRMIKSLSPPKIGCFCWLQMASPSDTLFAITHLDQTLFLHQVISVHKATLQQSANNRKIHIKLTTPEQVSGLRKGDILKRFPANGAPQEIFDETQEDNTDIYTIQSINPTNKTIGLIMTVSSQTMFAWPGDMERLAITPYHLLSEKTWWI